MAQRSNPVTADGDASSTTSIRSAVRSRLHAAGAGGNGAIYGDPLHRGASRLQHRDGIRAAARDPGDHDPRRPSHRLAPDALDQGASQSCAGILAGNEMRVHQMALRGTRGGRADHGNADVRWQSTRCAEQTGDRAGGSGRRQHQPVSALKRRAESRRGRRFDVGLDPQTRQEHRLGAKRGETRRPAIRVVGRTGDQDAAAHQPGVHDRTAPVNWSQSRLANGAGAPRH